jgi:hypothetical protein
MLLKKGAAREAQKSKVIRPEIFSPFSVIAYR